MIVMSVWRLKCFTSIGREEFVRRRRSNRCPCTAHMAGLAVLTMYCQLLLKLKLLCDTTQRQVALLLQRGRAMLCPSVVSLKKIITRLIIVAYASDLPLRSSVLQFFSRYPAMGVHPLLLEWHSSAMRNNIWWFLKGLLEGINGWFRSG